MTRLSKAQIAANELIAAKQVAAQQAELKRMRAEKRAATAAAKAEIKAELEAVITPAADAKPAFDAKAEDAKRYEQITAAWATLMDGFEVPSWKRAVTGVVIGLLAASGAGYIIGTLAGMLLTAVVTMTGMMWLGYVIAVLGIIAGGWLGARVGSSVYGYIANKQIDKHFDSAKTRVSGWFRKPAVVEQFTGVHPA